MDKKLKETFSIILIALVVVTLMFGAIALMILLSLSAGGEADCEVTNVSFTSNQTNQIQNLSMDNGSLHCKFKGSVPLIFLLRN